MIHHLINPHRNRITIDIKTSILEFLHVLIIIEFKQSIRTIVSNQQLSDIRHTNTHSHTDLITKLNAPIQYVYSGYSMNKSKR